jgi:beta-glucanase (GH16 family)
MPHHRFRPLLVATLFAASLLPSAHAQSPATSAPVASAPSPYVPAGYVEVFGDEFNGSSLDTSAWWTRYIYDNGRLDHLNDEAERFRENNNHVMTGNSLQLTARLVKDPVTGKKRYESGMIRSKMTFKYGYFEARVKMPPGKGMWPAFWLNSDSTPDGKISWPPEIDIFEFVNNGKDDKTTMFHMGAVSHKLKDGSPSPWGGELLSSAPHVSMLKGPGGEYFGTTDFTQDYHIFALLWDTDDTITWYLDGQSIMKRTYKWVYTSGQDAPYAHVLLNLAMGGQWAGRYGIDDSAFPQSFDLDYVRVYQKQGAQQTGSSTIGVALNKESSP